MERLQSEWLNLFNSERYSQTWHIRWKWSKVPAIEIPVQKHELLFEVGDPFLCAMNFNWDGPQGAQLERGSRTPAPVPAATAASALTAWRLRQRNWIEEDGCKQWYLVANCSIQLDTSHFYAAMFEFPKIYLGCHAHSSLFKFWPPLTGTFLETVWSGDHCFFENSGSKNGASCEI